MKTVLDLLLVGFLILVNAFFSGTEMAVITLNDAKIRKMGEEGNKRAKKVVKFLDNPSNFLATIQVGVTFAGFLSSAFAASSFADKVAALIDPSNKYKWMTTLCTVVITIVLSYFSLIFELTFKYSIVSLFFLYFFSEVSFLDLIYSFS